MRQTMRLFQIGMRQTARDGMLFALLPAPFLVGLIFKFALPLANGIMTDRFGVTLIFWFPLADGLLACLTPAFAAMASAFLLLEERDEGIGAFYQVSPAGGHAYLAARLGLPMLWAYAATAAALSLFCLTALPLTLVLALSALGSLTGAALAMMVVSLAGNRVEGLALSKMMGVSFLGLFLAWFQPPYASLSAWLPSYWVGMLLRDGAIVPVCFGFGSIVSLLWIAVFTRRFLNRIS